MRKIPKFLKKVKRTKVIFISEVQKGTEVVPLLKKKALQGSWSKKLQANCPGSTPTVNKKVIHLHIDKFIIMVWPAKLFQEGTPSKFMKVFKG